MSLKTVLGQQAYLLFYIREHSTQKEVCLLWNIYSRQIAGFNMIQATKDNTMTVAPFTTSN